MQPCYEKIMIMQNKIQDNVVSHPDIVQIYNLINQGISYLFTGQET